jgi:heme-degrading monooxygenase HmoA
VIVRMTSFSGNPEGLREGARIYEEQIVPWLQDATGFRGVMVLHDGAERALGLSFWESEADAISADEAMARFRADVSGAVGSTPLGAETYEVLLSVGPSLTLES